MYPSESCYRISSSANSGKRCLKMSVVCLVDSRSCTSPVTLSSRYLVTTTTSSTLPICLMSPSALRRSAPSCSRSLTTENRFHSVIYLFSHFRFIQERRACQKIEVRGLISLPLLCFLLIQMTIFPSYLETFFRSLL